MTAATERPHRGEGATIEIAMGISRNPLRWVLASIRSVLILSALVLTTYVGIAYGYFLDGPAGWIGFLLVGLGAWRFWHVTKEAYLVDCSRIRFFEDGIEVDRRVPLAKDNGLRTHGLRDLRHLELASLSEIRLTLKPVDGPPYQQVIQTTATQGEDTFDTLVDHLQTHAKGHLFSTVEHGHLDLSQECEWRDLFPDHAEPVTNWSRRDPGPAAGIRADERFVMTADGLVFALIEVDQYRVVKVRLWNDEEFSVWGSGDVRSGESLVGKTRAWPNQVGNIRIEVDLIGEIELEHPLPACLAEALVAVCNGSRKLLRI